MSATTLSGLAAKIRSTDGLTDAETFDLAGKDPTSVPSIMEGLADPFEQSVRITLVIGAGKLERQKYHDSLPKVVVSALKEHGFVDGVDDPGTYKMQHDTGKNLKTIVVFPKLRSSSTEQIGSQISDMAITGSNNDDQIRLPGAGSPVYLVSTASEAIFEKMLSSKIQSWSQKKTCSSILSDISESVKALQDKLFSGSPLSEFQQDFYDTATLDLLISKQNILKKSMVDQVDKGSITKEEKTLLLEQVSTKLNIVKDEIEIAEKESKSKKVEKLREVLKKLESRRGMLNKKNPQPPQTLQTEPQIAKLRAELKPLAKLEIETKGRLLSIGEQAKMTRKSEIEEEICNLENSAREWFEDDESFAVRVGVSQLATKEALKRITQKSSKSSSSSSSNKNSRTASWATTGTKKVGSTWSLPTAPKKKTSSSSVSKQKPPGGMFAAMMNSDSDSD